MGKSKTPSFIVELPLAANSEQNLTFYIYGWSDTVLQYISYSINGYGNMIDKVRTIEI